MSDGDFEIKRNIAQPMIIVVLLIFIGLQLAGLGLEEHASQTYVSFYQYLVLLGAVGIVAMSFFQIKYGFRLIESSKIKLAMFGIFILFITLITINAGQIIPVPKASVQDFQLSKGTEMYTASVIPGITEDLTYLWLLPLAIALTGLGLYEWKIGEADKPVIAVAVVLACLVASTGYNIWLVPGFTSAHIPAYGQSDAYLGAWIFSFGQSAVYMTTGWFFPAAHIIHNLMISYSHLYQISVFGIVLIGG